MIISHIADLAAAKRVEKVLAAVQQFLECVQTVLEKWQKHHLFLRWKNDKHLCMPSAVYCCQCHIDAATCSDWNMQLVRK